MAKSCRKVVVELFYDVISPYSYIAFEDLTRFARKHNLVDLQLQPALIAGIMQQTGNRPPGMVPAKAKYMGEDLLRLSSYHKIPFKVPADIGQVMFVKGSLASQRLLTATKVHFPQHLESLTRELYLRVWFKDLDISTVESLQEACDVVGISKEDTSTLVLAVQETEMKEKLKEQTKSAIDHGAFGLPVYVAHLESGPEMFFGSDRIHMLAHYLKVSYP